MTRQLVVRAATLCAGAVLAFAGALRAEDLTIAELAPRRTAFLVNVPDFTALKAAFDRTGFKNAWDDPAIQEWVKRHTRDMAEDYTNFLDELEIDEEDLSPPAGTAGIAVWPAETEEGEMVFRMLLLADYGDRAEAMDGAVLAAIARAEEKEHAEVTEEEYGEATIRTIVLPDEAESAPAGEDEEGVEAEEEDVDMEGWEEEPAPDPFRLEKVHYVRSGRYLLASSDRDALERALDRLGGKAMDSLHDDEHLAQAVGLLEGAQAYAAVLPGPLYELWQKSVEAADPQFADQGMAPFDASQLSTWAEMAGLKDVQAAAFGMRFDTDAGMSESTVCLLLPRKRGLWSLVDGDPKPVGLPSFVSADAAAAQRLHFRIDGIIPMIREIMGGDPEDQGAAMTLQVLDQVEPMFALLGPEIYQVRGYRRPFGADSQQTIFAISVKDARAFNDALSGFAPQIGLESRDFNGNVIWSMPPGAMPIPVGEFSLGVGFGHLFVGPTTLVENAMRQAGQPENPALSKDPRFTRATRILKPAGLMFSYADMKQVLEWTDWSIRNADKLVMEQLKKQYGDDPEFADWRDQMAKDQAEAMPEWLRDMPSLDLLRRHVGDAVSEIHSTPEGFTGRFIWLRPAEVGSPGTELEFAL